MAPDPGPLPSSPNHNQPLVKNPYHRFCQAILSQHSQLPGPFQPVRIKIVISMAGSSDLSGRVPPLPFENAPDGLQESWLGPSQAASRNAESFRVFHDNPCTESQFRNAYNASDGRATGLESAPMRPQLRPLYLDYQVYHRSVASQLGQSSGANEWCSVIPPKKSETVWKVDLSYYSWDLCKQEIIFLCGPTREHIDKHLRRLEAEGLLKWQCILHRDGMFAQNKNYFATNDEDFAPFVQAFSNNLTNKAMIKIIMEDPNRSAKDSEEAKKVNDSLALNYADEDTRLALQRVHTRLAVNPKSDVSAQERGRLVAEITRHIKGKYGCDAESMRMRDPVDPKRSIRVTTEALRAWSRAMLHGEPGVDLDNPPKCKECTPEDVAVLTLDEMAANRKLDCPGTRGHHPQQSRRRRPGLFFTPPRRSASGRILAPRLMTGDPGQSHDSTAAAPRRSSNLSNSTSISVRSNTPAVRVDLGASKGYEDLTEPGDEHEVSWRTSTPVEDDVPRDVSTQGTDIEVLPSGTILRSPSRKLARSPVGEGIVHNFSRLEFERPRSPSRYLSVSPTRKRPGSQASLSYPSVDMTDKAPLNELGRALTIDDFLGLCNFTDDDHIPRVLISLNHIRRWDFFLNTNFYVLQKMGFPYPIATQLLKGAKWLEATHVQLDTAGIRPAEASAAHASVDGLGPKSVPDPAHGSSSADDAGAPPVAGPSGARVASRASNSECPESIPDSNEADNNTPSLGGGGATSDADYQPSPEY
ncbi:uncharacterized protein PGTG_02194 [Puccinia graminis f. sp. tritici CRL 75-36-700-3]|uniref:Uncharacterized protein n=1 Tax=Puccinia graminis f. sp. tritici (strain CRL 75-36-700-3 / race SCCL) TaxID=418459 RepID=E3JXF8_PUCGT|nr:uncharacterized protein PGTG_02194 [Puccinia graminis f. sp. tritici CRL 75-36-700-3]EFP76733.1 hypothetical protein PGTG_02194 [Puccinia graminis f. sp. tritici CRL 75-36-700-3]